MHATVALNGTKYRYTLSGEAGNTNVWLENRTTKQQYECKLDSVADCAPKGITLPLDVIMRFLAVAFATADKNATSNQLLQLEGTADEDNVVLVAKLNIAVGHAQWTPQFRFPLRALPLDELAVLTTRLRDVEDQLAAQQEGQQELTKPLAYVNLVLRMEQHAKHFDNDTGDDKDGEAETLDEDDSDADDNDDDDDDDEKEDIGWRFRRGTRSLVDTTSSALRFERAGTFQLHAVITSDCNCAVHVHKNGKVLLKLSKRQSVVVALTETMAVNDTIEFRHTCDSKHKGHLAITELR